MSEYEGGTFRCTICAKEFLSKAEADRHFSSFTLILAFRPKTNVMVFKTLSQGLSIAISENILHPIGLNALHLSVLLSKRRISVIFSLLQVFI
jgi:hypothetical protein